MSRRDFIAICGLGILFYFLFPYLSNQSLELTTAARGSLIMSLLLIMALSIGVAFKVETLNLFKVLGCALTILRVGLVSMMILCCALWARML